MEEEEKSLSDEIDCCLVGRSCVSTACLSLARTHIHAHAHAHAHRAPVFTDDFVVAGTCAENLYGTCESLYRPDQSPDELFETLAQALLAAVDRDALSGWGGVVHIMYVCVVLSFFFVHAPCQIGMLASVPIAPHFEMFAVVKCPRHRHARLNPRTFTSKDAHTHKCTFTERQRR